MLINHRVGYELRFINEHEKNIEKTTNLYELKRTPVA